ncbi:MAG: hypothetical protein LRY54_03550 [Alphaproteobacteria bacterium]|nr:hypothetical protein [Alphaproteobacteria bacterium]
MGNFYEGSAKDVELAVKTHRARELAELKMVLTKAHYLATGAQHEKLLPESDIVQTLESIGKLTQTIQNALDEETRKLAASGTHFTL